MLVFEGPVVQVTEGLAEEVRVGPVEALLLAEPVELELILADALVVEDAECERVAGALRDAVVVAEALREARGVSVDCEELLEVLEELLDTVAVLEEVTVLVVVELADVVFV